MANAPTTPVLLRTLAIAPGTRAMGYAILEGTEPLHFGVHSSRMACRSSVSRPKASGS